MCYLFFVVAEKIVNPRGECLPAGIHIKELLMRAQCGPDACRLMEKSSLKKISNDIGNHDPQMKSFYSQALS